MPPFTHGSTVFDFYLGLDAVHACHAFDASANVYVRVEPCRVNLRLGGPEGPDGPDGNDENGEEILKKIK